VCIEKKKISCGHEQKSRADHEIGKKNKNLKSPQDMHIDFNQRKHQTPITRASRNGDSIITRG